MFATNLASAVISAPEICPTLFNFYIHTFSSFKWVTPFCLDPIRRLTSRLPNPSLRKNRLDLEGSILSANDVTLYYAQKNLLGAHFQFLGHLMFRPEETETAVDFSFLTNCRIWSNPADKRRGSPPHSGFMSAVAGQASVVVYLLLLRVSCPNFSTNFL